MEELASCRDREYQRVYQNRDEFDIPKKHSVTMHPFNAAIDAFKMAELVYDCFLKLNEHRYAFT